MRAATKPFLLCLALLVSAELVVRVFFARSMSGRFDYGYHPTSGFVELADGTVRLERAGGRRFFPQSFARERAADTFRIFVIGDSVARGTSVASSYAGQLGEQLRARGVKTESFNLSVPGYGARRKELVLAQALKYQPSLVILHVNDSNEYEDEREWRRREEFRGWHPRNWLMKCLLIRRLHEMKQEKVFWEWLPASVRNQRATSDADAEIKASLNAEKVLQWTELVRKVTGESVAAAWKENVRVLLVSQATTDLKAAGSMPDDHGLDALCGAMHGDGVSMVSMKESLIGRDAKLVYSDGSHLLTEGHKVLAETIAAKLTELRWLPPQPGR
jgi:lysophospholipase L1-like esterase